MCVAETPLSDSPISLVVSALKAIPVLTGTERTGFDFTLYTGDLVSHDSENQLSRYDSSGHDVYTFELTIGTLHRDYVLYTEVSRLLIGVICRPNAGGRLFCTISSRGCSTPDRCTPHSGITTPTTSKWTITKTRCSKSDVPHHSTSRAQDAPHSLGGQLASQFSWYVILNFVQRTLMTYWRM